MKKQTLPIIVGLVVIFLGSFIVTYFNLYTSYPHIDKVFHISGGIIVAWFFSRLWIDKLGAFTRLEHLIILASLAALVGFLWELIEFSMSYPPMVYYPLLRHYIYTGGFVDTLGDLIADIFGGALLGLLYRG